MKKKLSIRPDMPGLEYLRILKSIEHFFFEAYTFDTIMGDPIRHEQLFMDYLERNFVYETAKWTVNGGRGFYIDIKGDKTASVIRVYIEKEHMLLGYAAMDIIYDYGEIDLSEVKFNINQELLIQPYDNESAAESYPKNWKHCMIHLDPDTGEMHSDGDHSVREWIQDRMIDPKTAVVSKKGVEGITHKIQLALGEVHEIKG